MLIVIALGGNALLQHNEPLEANRLKKNCLHAASLIASVAKDHQILLVHGNGPQVGLLALQAQAYKEVQPYPLDVLDAESQGMIGYLLQNALTRFLLEQPVITLLTQVIVDQNDPAFNHPSKPIGPFYSDIEADKIRQQFSWTLKPINGQFRRVVPSPKPLKIHELQIIKTLVQQGVLTIAGGGGGIPCVYHGQEHLRGIEAVVDKDLTASLLAQSLAADRLIILSDIDAVYENWGTALAKPIYHASPQALQKQSFAAGSMQPKIDAVCQFVNNTNQEATIGHLNDLPAILEGKAGTHIRAE